MGFKEKTPDRMAIKILKSIANWLFPKPKPLAEVAEDVARLVKLIVVIMVSGPMFVAILQLPEPARGVVNVLASVGVLYLSIKVSWPTKRKGNST